MKKPIQTIGKYVIERQLGSGTMGTVFLGYDSILDQRRAIKVMNSGVEDEELRKRFFREARAAAKLDHPNIMRILDLDIDSNNHPYIVMEYVEGEDLKTYIDQKRYLPFARKLKIIEDICAGLDHAHEEGIIHRDIKPGNIRISRRGDAKILDFGLARLVTAEASFTGGVIGSPYYMSPEQWRGTRDLDRRSDLFSVAAVLYELITYIRPFEADGITAVMTRIISEPHVPLRGNLPACASELSSILDRGLAKDREQRFSSCLDFSRALVAFQSELPALREEVHKKVDQIASELERLKQRSEELHILEFLDSAAFEKDETDSERSRFLDAVPPNEISDYGVLLQRHAYLQEQLDSHNKKFRAALPLLRQLRTAHSQFDQRQFEACQDTLQELLLASPSNTSSLLLLEACRKAIRERNLEEERQARLQNLISQVRQAVDLGQPKKALKFVSELLEIAPSYPEASELRDRIRENIAARLKEKNKRIAELLQVCRDLLQAREYDAALSASQKIMELSSTEE